MAITRAWNQTLHKPESLTLSQWADKNFYLSAESSYVEGKWETVPFQKAPMDCISNDDIRIVDFIKAARVGYTKMLLAALGYFHEHKKRNTVLFQPTDDDAEDFSLTELSPMLRDVGVMKAVFPWGQTSNKYNRLLKKTFIGSVMDIRGGKAGGNYRRMTKDCVFYDELEAFDRDIDGEGSPLTLGDKRVSNSLYPKSVRGTTPKDDEGSIIQEEVENADFFFRYHLPCPHCQYEQVLIWGKKDKPGGFRFQWPSEFSDSITPQEDAAKTIYYACISCNQTIYNNQLDVMLKNGRWIDPSSGVWIDDSISTFKNKENEIIDPPRHVAFHIWTAYSPWFTWSEMLHDYFDAITQKKKKGLLDKLKSFVNTTLGETWKSTTKPLEHGSLFARREHYPTDSEGELLLPRNALALFAGLDMQDDRVEGELRAYDEQQRSYLIGYFRLFGNPKEPELWDALEAEINKKYKTADGRELGVMRACFDSGGHFTQEVYKFCKRIGVYRMIPTKGWNDYDKPTTFPRKSNIHGVYLTMVDTESAKDALSYRHQLLIEDGQGAPAGYCHYPVADFTSEEYFKQLTAEEKELMRHNRKTRMVWVSKGRRNEPWDCAVGSFTALEISINHFGLDLVFLAADRDNAAPVTQQSSWSDLGKRNRT